ncbi:MAG: substrate-binding domain-containing protein [Cytophagaceae bacterium]|nr:substrate-binding domain-containing protein [Cytophagaceae bacterium]
MTPVKAIFVTNSRAYKVASVLEKNKIKGIKILGYDLIDPNIQYLKKGFIDFLISQEPFNQGYMGIMSLYNHLILNQEVEQQKLMPITLITKENLEFYKA